MVSTKCHLHAQNDIAAQFNCTDALFGVMGVNPVAQDSNVPTNMTKLSAGFQYGYFADASLSQSYGSQTFDSNDNITSWLPDSDLLNPMYLGIGGRIQDAGGSSGTQLRKDPEILANGDGYLDFVLNCSFTA